LPLRNIEFKALTTYSALRIEGEIFSYASFSESLNVFYIFNKTNEGKKKSEREINMMVMGKWQNVS
jgi:hypothetical protein